MAENNLIVYKVQVDTASGKIAIDGLTKGFVQASTAVTKLTNETKKLSAATAEAGTASGIAGAVVNEFGRFVSDLPYGIQAVSNNISQLGSLFAVMAVSAGSAKQALKDIKETLKASPILLYLLAFQAVVSVITYFDKQSSKATKSVNELAQATGTAASSLKVAKEALDSENTSMKEKQEIVAALNKEYPSLNAEIDKNGKLTKESSEAIDKQIDSMVRLAKAQAILKLIEAEMAAISVAQAKTAEESLSLSEKVLAGIGSGLRTGNFILGVQAAGQQVKRETIAAATETKDRLTAILEKEGLVDLLFKGEDGKTPLTSKVKKLGVELIGTTEDQLNELKKTYQRIFGSDVFSGKEQMDEMKENALESLKGLKAIDTSVRDNQTKLEIYNYNKNQAAKEATLAAMADFGNQVASFLDDDFQRQLDIEQNKTNALNNELRQRLLNESLSADERKKIQGEIAKNDEDLRKKQEKIERKRFEMQKAANISRAVIDTYVAANAALKNGGGVPTGLPPMIATIAAGLLQVASISKQQFVSSQSGVPLSVGTLSDGGTAAQAPEFNIVGQGSVNQLAAAVQSQFDRPMKTYVVAKEVASANELERNVIKTATIG